MDWFSTFDPRFLIFGVTDWVQILHRDDQETKPRASDRPKDNRIVTIAFRQQIEGFALIEAMKKSIWWH